MLPDTVIDFGVAKAIGEQLTERTIYTRFAQMIGTPLYMRPEVSGDLDYIVMKALEKDRRRRYETASGLAADVRRFLADEPVEARPPSATYRFHKFARRHRVTLTTGTAIAAVLLLGTVVSTWQAIRAEHARRLAIQISPQVPGTPYLTPAELPMPVPEWSVLGSAIRGRRKVGPYRTGP